MTYILTFKFKNDGMYKPFCEVDLTLIHFNLLLVYRNLYSIKTVILHFRYVIWMMLL